MSPAAGFVKAAGGVSSWPEACAACSRAGASTALGEEVFSVFGSRPSTSSTMVTNISNALLFIA
jgi:hypothetical protein